MKSGEKPDALIAEYNSLRTEVLESDKTCVQIMSIVLSLAGVLVACAVSEKKPMLLLAPLPFLWIAYRYVAEKRWVIYKIGSYIRCHVDFADVGMGWEKALGDARRKRGYRLPGGNIIATEFWMVHLTGVVCLCLFEYSTKLSVSHWLRYGPVIAYVAGAAISAAIYYRLRKLGSSGKIDLLWSTDDDSKDG
jgi:hypothetical protein